MRKLLVSATALALAASASAAIVESVTYNNVLSRGLLGAPNNEIRTYNVTGSYANGLSAVYVAGTLTEINTGTYASEARVQVTHPLGLSRIYQPFTTTSFTGSIAIPAGSNFVHGYGVQPGGTWTFRFYESFDDGSDGVEDARWDDITFSYDDNVTGAAQPSATNLGTVVAPGLDVDNSIGANGEVDWYKFVVPQGVGASLSTFLYIDTEGSALAPSNDTEIGLYDAFGNLIATDDDDGSGLLSLMKFGQGGTDGDLFPGEYFLAVSSYNAVFSPGFSVTGGTSNTGNYHINIDTNVVPEPASLLLIGLGVALLRRR